MYQPIGGGGDSIIDNYLTIVALENGLTAQLSVNACEYCVDGDGDWKALSADTNTSSINKGQTLSFRGNLTPVSYRGIGTFTISKSCNLEGNCMSMLFGDEASSNVSLSGKNYAFYHLFYNCTAIKSVSSNFLPVTTLAQYCYYEMFKDCTSLTTAPALPATTLENNCYRYMFYGCTNLITTPALPATTLVSDCYSYMFKDCTSLTTAPALPATTLVDSCYVGMFQGCTGLTIAPALPATTLATNCYYAMFYGCTSLITAPALPATTLVDGCYGQMFSGCSKLNYIKAMFTTTPATKYTYNWINGVALTGTFVKHPDANWSLIGTYGVPSIWSVKKAWTEETNNASKDNEISILKFPLHLTVEFNGGYEDGYIYDEYVREGDSIGMNLFHWIIKNLESVSDSVFILESEIPSVFLESHPIYINDMKVDSIIGEYQLGFDYPDVIMSVTSDNYQTFYCYVCPDGSIYCEAYK